MKSTFEIRDQVETYLRKRQAQLQLIAARLLEVNTVHSTELAELLRECSSTETAVPEGQRSWGNTSLAQPSKNASCSGPICCT
jgi:hypothetical protein